METQGTHPKVSVKQVNDRLDKQEIRMDEIEASVAALVRRVETVQKSVDLLMQDREILETIQATLVSLKEHLIQSREHTDNIVREVKADIADSSKETVQKVETIQESVDDTVTGFIDRIEKKKTVVIAPRKRFSIFDLFKRR